jgi:uroporphyrinogen decarboxylase
MMDAFNYNHPDRIPVVYHPSTAGLFVHGQKLIDLFNQYPPDNPITYIDIPKPVKDAFDQQGNYHEIKTDEWGTTMQFRIFGIAGHPKAYPFDSWNEGLTNYQFPKIPVSGSAGFIAQKQITEEQKKEFLVFNGWISIFEKLHALRPFQEMLMDIVLQDENFLAFLDKLVEYWISVIDYYILTGTDVFVFGDDWGTMNSTLVSPDSFREIFKPLYQRLFRHIQKSGGLIFLHCCGYMGELLDEFIEMGIRGLWPQLNLYDKDESFTSKCRMNKIAIYIHPDRQRLIPLGTPHQIDSYIRIAADKYRKLGGGGIFYVEIENDAPFENVKALVEAINKYR